MPYQNPKYIGDGVYISHDASGHLWLAVGDHNNDVVALEPEVFERVVTEFIERIDIPQPFEHRVHVAEWLRDLIIKLESHET